MYSPNTPGTWMTSPTILGPDGNPINWREEQQVEPGISIPHAYVFQSIISGAFKTFQMGQQDAALRHDPGFANAMMLDPFLMGILRERIDSIVALEAHLETDDDKDPVRRAVRDGVWATVLQTTRLQDMLSYLMLAIWFGKYGSQLVYEDRLMMLADPKNPQQKVPTVCPVVTNHQPEDGDKFGFRWSGDPYMLVNSAYVSQIPGMEIINTSGPGQAVVLTGTLRDKFILHAHERRDAPYQSGEQAASIYGMGIRNTIYWLSWIRMELYAHIHNYTERTGLGLKIWRFDGNNPASKAAVEEAAKRQTDRTNILLPFYRDIGGKGTAEGVEVVDTSTAGAELLLKMLKEYQDQIELYVIGQTLSRSTEGSGLGGSGVAAMHGDTKWRLMKLDAQRLAETLTTDWVRKILAWQYPEHADMPLRWKFSIAPFNGMERLQAVNLAYSMGVDFAKKDVRELTGLPDPQQDEELISLAQTQQMSAAMNPQPVPGDGDGDGVGFEDQNEDEDLSWLTDQVGSDQPEMAGV